MMRQTLQFGDGEIRLEYSDQLYGPGSLTQKVEPVLWECWPIVEWVKSNHTSIAQAMRAYGQCATIEECREKR